MTIAFTNQKGGVGKTTSAINLGACLVELGHSVLLVDFDSQANLTSGLGQREKKPSIYDVLSNKAEITESIQTTYQENLFLIPSSNALCGAAVELISLEEREYYLKNALLPIKNNYDFIFIDCPPSLDVLTINAFCASDSIMIPLQCEYFAMEGIAQLIKNIQYVQKKANPTLKIFGIVLTMYDKRTNLSQEVASEIVKAFGGYVHKTIIPRNIKIAEAPSFGKSVLAYDKECLGTESYRQLAKEVIFRWKTEQKKL